jgi:RNA polymerase sigma-70 factor (ECF subfamily)
MDDIRSSGIIVKNASMDHNKAHRESLRAVRETLAGDREAFQYLVHRYREELLRIAYSFLGSWDDALDLTQNTFMRLYTTLDSYDQKRSLRTWILTIHLNLCRSAFARRSRLPSGSRIDPELLVSPQPEENGNLLWEIIHNHLERLSWQQRSAFQLVILDGLSSSEAAVIMKCSPVTLRVHLMRAKRRLKAVLKARGVEL